MMSSLLGGDDMLVHLFFITFFFNSFIVLSFIYNLFDLLFFHNLQGFKLNIKKQKL